MAGRGRTAVRRSHPESELAERVKELNCLYSVSRLFARRDLPLPSLLQQAVGLIARGWQYPEITEVAIRMEDEEYRTSPFLDSPWRQETPVLVHGEPAGRLVVSLREERPTRDEGPFLDEERNLLNVLAQLIGEVTERKRAEEQLVNYRKQLRSLAVELTRVEERDRRNLSREIHDGIGQELALMQIRLGMVREQLDDGPGRTAVDEIRRMVAGMIRQVRSLVFEISPPVLYEHGLAAALEWLTQQAQERYGIDVLLEVGGGPFKLSGELAAVLYRSASELLANVGRHALATRAWITFTRPAVMCG